MATSLPIAIIYGIYLGVLTGIIPSLVAGTLGFLFKYITNVTLPGFGVVVLAVALAGINGGLLALADPTILDSANAPTIMTGLLVVMMMSLYAHAKGDQLGASVPRRISLRKLGEQTLSTDLVDVVAGRNEIRIHVVGEIEDIEGYPPLPDDLRAKLRDTDWRFPADLQVSELESRLAERLRTEFDLGDVTVSIDERGRATVAAAPPFSGLSRRVESGRRAVSVDGLVPTGLARGDVVTAITDGAQVRGQIVSARSSEASAETQPEPSTESKGEAGEPEVTPPPSRAPTTSGGEGQATIAVSRTDAGPLLRTDSAKLVVESQGTRHEYEVLSLLRRSGKRFRRLTVRAGGALDGISIGLAKPRENYDVAVLVVRTASGWQFAPPGTTTLAAGDELFVVGTSAALDRFGEVVA
ncbi:potassium channel family protein [Halapricum salinum]|uniref:Potassium transporter TrkA n=1 Tax=Halapricum salinum TaxID=1457250 RepID=A0A4D6H962_9EURY|nr:TrkA C-terminal domain-containing protein [Halapricum salinum]QCC50330.1 potassium transporter TrkA [Halapricum salinum]